MEKKIKQVCKCDHCGNEAEMVITCTLQEDEVQAAGPAPAPPPAGKTRGHGVCSHCGNEADIWVDL